MPHQDFLLLALSDEASCRTTLSGFTCACAYDAHDGIAKVKSKSDTLRLAPTSCGESPIRGNRARCAASQGFKRCRSLPAAYRTVRSGSAVASSCNTRRMDSL